MRFRLIFDAVYKTQPSCIVYADSLEAARKIAEGVMDDVEEDIAKVQNWNESMGLDNRSLSLDKIEKLDNDADQLRQMPRMKNEKQFIQYGLIFGHYDGRGGAGLLADPSIINGMRRYNVSCEWEVEDNSAFKDLQEGSCGHIEIAVVGRKLGDIEEELLHSHGGDFTLYRVETCRIITREDDASPWMKWTKRPWVVLVESTGNNAEVVIDFDNWKEGIFGQEYEYKFVKWDVGEDGCGLVNLGIY